MNCYDLLSIILTSKSSFRTFNSIFEISQFSKNDAYFPPKKGGGSFEKNQQNHCDILQVCIGYACFAKKNWEHIVAASIYLSISLHQIVVELQMYVLKLYKIKKIKISLLIESLKL